MSLFGRLVSQWASEVAVDKLARNPTFQKIAVKTVDGVAAAKQTLENTVKEVAADPARAAATVQEHSGTFWTHLKREVMKDVNKFTKS